MTLHAILVDSKEWTPWTPCDKTCDGGIPVCMPACVDFQIGPAAPLWDRSVVPRAPAEPALFF